MNIIRAYFVVLLSLSLFLGCTQRDAATVGATIGRTVATPIGTTAVIIDEAAQSTGEIVKQNPRYDQPAASVKTLKTQPAKPSPPMPQGAVRIATNYDRFPTEASYDRSKEPAAPITPGKPESNDSNKSQDIPEFWH